MPASELSMGVEKVNPLVIKSSSVDTVVDLALQAVPKVAACIRW